MTRQWNVDPRLLCQNHLQGEYNEIHKLLGGIAHHPHGVAILRGQQQDSNIDLSTIARRYDRVAAEMARRGYKHDATLTHAPIIEAGHETPISVNRNLEDLYERCEQCRDRIRSQPEVVDDCARHP